MFMDVGGRKPSARLLLLGRRLLLVASDTYYVAARRLLLLGRKLLLLAPDGYDLSAGLHVGFGLVLVCSLLAVTTSRRLRYFQQCDLHLGSN